MSIETASSSPVTAASRQHRSQGPLDPYTIAPSPILAAVGVGAYSVRKNICMGPPPLLGLPCQ